MIFDQPDKESRWSVSQKKRSQKKETRRHQLKTTCVANGFVVRSTGPGAKLPRFKSSAPGRFVTL